MKKMLIILGLVLGGILLFELVIFQSIVPESVSWTQFEAADFHGSVPAGPRSFVEEHGWHKRNFSGFGQLYISTRRFAGNAHNEILFYRQYVDPVFEADVKVFENGRFLIEKHGKGRKYIYIFSVDDRLFWVENYAARSSLRAFKDVVDDVLRRLVINGKMVSSAFDSTSTLRSLRANPLIIS